MTAIACAIASAICFYFSVGLGDQWWLAWLAPIPMLWLAFGETKGWQVFFASWAALALGSTSILRAYGGTLPPFVIALSLGAPSLLFAASVMGARRVQRAFGGVAAMFAFALLWTAFEFLASFNLSGGSVASVAASQVGAPMLMQSASLVSYLGITFLLGAVSAGIAACLRMRDPVPAAIAVALFAANAAFGYRSMSTPPTGTLHVALVESDDAVGGIRKTDKGATLKAIGAYATEIEKLKGRHVSLIVLPENIAKLEPQWREEAEATLSTAANDVGATLIAGFNTHLDGAQRNVSIAFTQSAPPVIYQKRRLVPVLETKFYTPGPGPKVLANGIGLEVCKDMDFEKMLRDDEVATHPTLLAVPAWDFDKDDWSHARVAVLRSVENGVPMARSARDGLLTLNDRYGRIVARARTVGAFTTLIGDLPLDGRGGDTIYDRTGNAFGWLCVVLGFGLASFAFGKEKGRHDSRPFPFDVVRLTPRPATKRRAGCRH